MRVLLPVHHFPPRYNAGAELYTFRLARWMKEHGHTVEVVCVESIDCGRPDQLAVESDYYEGLLVHRLSYDIFHAPQRRRWDFDNPLIGNWFRDYLAQYRPDIAHFQAGYLLSAAAFRAVAEAHIPLFLTLHDFWFLCPRITLQRGDGTLCDTIPEDPAGCVWCQRTEQRRYQAADRYSGGIAGKVAQATLLHDDAIIQAERRVELARVLQMVSLAIAPSRYLAGRYASLVPADRLKVVRYGLDVSRFDVQSARPADSPLRIGFIGQIARHKGVHLLIRAFRSLREQGRPIELYLHGGLEANPQYVTELQALAAGDQRIHFKGRFANTAAPSILAKFDVAVVPSTWYENSPLAIMEAHAAGVPVITARLGGMAEMVTHEIDGLLFEARSSDDLTRQLQRLLDEPDLMGTLRAGVVTPRTIEDEMHDLIAMYDSTVSMTTRR